MTDQRQRQHGWHNAAGTIAATLAIVAGFLALTITPVSAATTTTAAATTTTTTTTTTPTTTTSTTTTTAVPGSNCSASVSGTALDRTGWVASTNEDQAPGLYFEVDLGSAQAFNELEMSVPNSPTDYARGYDVEVSTNASSWAIVASCTGTATPEVVSFDAQTVRYVKVVLTATTTSQWWSIDELNLYGPTPTTTTTTVPSPAPTTASLSSSANPAPVGQAVTYTVKVVPVPNGGTVNFFANGAPITGCDKVALNATTGAATCAATYLL